MEQTIELPLIRTSVPKKESLFQRFYRSLCCCCRRSSVNSNFSWKPWHIWDKIREKLSKKQTLNKTYKLLLDLYSHQTIELDINDCKWFPDFNSQSRDDLEFYIPQLW